MEAIWRTQSGSPRARPAELMGGWPAMARALAPRRRFLRWSFSARASVQGCKQSGKGCQHVSIPVIESGQRHPARARSALPGGQIGMESARTQRGQTLTATDNRRSRHRVSLTLNTGSGRLATAGHYRQKRRTSHRPGAKKSAFTVFEGISQLAAAFVLRLFCEQQVELLDCLCAVAVRGISQGHFIGDASGVGSSG